MNNNIFGVYWTKKFSDIYPTYASFSTDFSTYQQLGLNPNFSSTTTIQTAYYLLLAKYCNSTIANFDENQFKLKLFSKIFQFGPTWEKNLSIQSTLRGLSETELMKGTRQVSQHAFNPSTDVNTGVTTTDGEIDTTNEQNRTWYKKSKVEAYGNLMGLLEKDVTEDFLRRFKDLFIMIVEQQAPLLYGTSEDEEI